MEGEVVGGQGSRCLVQDNGLSFSGFFALPHAEVCSSTRSFLSFFLTYISFLLADTLHTVGGYLVRTLIHPSFRAVFHVVVACFVCMYIPGHLLPLFFLASYLLILLYLDEYVGF